MEQICWEKYTYLKYQYSKHFEGIWNPVIRCQSQTMTLMQFQFNEPTAEQNLISIIQRWKQMKCLFSLKHLFELLGLFRNIWESLMLPMSQGKICANLPRFYQHRKYILRQRFRKYWDMFWDLKKKIVKEGLVWDSHRTEQEDFSLKLWRVIWSSCQKV